MVSYKTDQESFWAGEFGTQYIQRNRSNNLLSANINFFSKALHQTSAVTSCIEFGANIGMNLKAIKLLYPHLQLYGIEINKEAANMLSEVIPQENVYHTSIMEFELREKWDLVLIKGVLIHINPDELNLVYDKLVAASRRYLLVAEYYSPEPVSVHYRGHSDRLFKRDFAGDIMVRHPQMQLIDYGFVYRNDPNFPQDDINWFLLEKRS